MSKEILFYSERCDYSMKVFNMVKDKTSILKVCIDDPSIKLPSFVEAVPLIYIPKDKRVIVDDAVEMWITTNFKGSSAEPSSVSQQNPSSNNVSFKTNNAPSGDYYTGGFSFSTQFSALEGEDLNGLDGGCGFANLTAPMESIVTPKDDGNRMDTNAMFEQYQQMRNKEFSGKSRN